MPKIREVAESVNKLAVPERHPYAGDWSLQLSGSRKMRLKKGWPRWTVVVGKSLLADRSCGRGRSYESIRVGTSRVRAA